MSFRSPRAPRAVRRGLAAVLSAGLSLAALTSPAKAQIVFDGNIIFGNGNLTQAGQYRTENMTAACAPRLRAGSGDEDKVPEL